MLNPAKNKPVKLIRQRFSFVISSQFPRERELLSYLFEMPNKKLSVMTTQLILLGLKTAGQRSQLGDFEMDDNFPWLAISQADDFEAKSFDEASKNIFLRCQINLYPHIEDHCKVISLISDLSNERRSDVLRRLSLRGLRIQACTTLLAFFSTNRLQSVDLVEPLSQQPIKNNSGPTSQASYFSEKFEQDAPTMFIDAPSVVNPPCNRDPQSARKLSESGQNSMASQTIKTPPKRANHSDNEIRARVPAFRKSPEFSPTDQLIEINGLTNKDTDKDGVVVIKNTPMKEKQGSSLAISGLAAMMGGFAGMNADGTSSRNE